MGKNIEWNLERKENAFNLILSCIEEGQSLNQIINTRTREETPSYSGFMVWINEDEHLLEKYTHACARRADLIFDEIIEIADDNHNDYKDTERGRIVDQEHIQRSRLKVDARKWYLGKLDSKRFGEKMELSGQVKIEQITGMKIE